jgi:hypothetical protein
MKLHTIGLYSLLAVSSFTYADTVKSTTNHFELNHQNAAAVIDGVIDESVWQNATEVNLNYENYPGEGIKAPVKTQVFMYEDSDSLYIAIRAYDPQPEKIRANLSDRDALWGDDNVSLIIDTFNDERSGYQFFVNPLGVQGDSRMTDTNGWQDDDSWDAIWESAAKVDAQGWTAEMRIPFRALRFVDIKGEKTWSFALQRNYPRDVRYRLASYQADSNLKCSLCLFDKITGLKTVESNQSIQLTPTMTLARNDRKKPISEPWDQGSVEQEAGLDLRWGITQDSVLNVTVNPDFSQVEADSSQLDVNNTFSLFTREKRAFFLDGADYFQTKRFNLVHTRNIADPDYGVKLTGKNGDHSYGLLVANDNQTAFLLPGNQGSSVYDAQVDSKIAIARYKADIGERNNIGGLVTSRKGDGYANNVASVDGSYWVNDENTVEYQWAYSSSTNTDALQSDYGLEEKQQDHAYSVGYFHNTRDYQWNLSYEDVGEDFRADIGFARQVDYKQLTAGGGQNYYGEKEALLNRYGYFVYGDITYDQAGEQLSRSIDLRGSVNGPMQFFANFGVNAGKQAYQNKHFDYGQLTTYSTIKPTSDLGLQLFIGLGKQIDYANVHPGKQLNMQLTVDWQLGQHFSVNWNHFYNTMKVEAYTFTVDDRAVNFDTGTVYTANTTDIRFAYQFDIQSQLKLTIQYTDIDRNEDLYKANFDEDDDNDVHATNRYFSTQLLYSYKVNPQTLVYLGYSDGGFQTGDMSKLNRDKRTVFAKFSYAWQA